ncbi:MAG TPA: histidine phosphatase family protein [Trebonia sp.]|jgi:hypothetical protein|nr:histidine phosphatase family protein [Trebonia sp.]
MRYLPLWEEVAAAARAGAAAVVAADGQPKSVQTGFSDTARTMADTDQFARRFGEHPVIVVVCADLAQTHPSMTFPTSPRTVRPGDSGSAEAHRLFIFARHAESTANAERVLSSDASRPVALTATGRAEARVLGMQLANVRVDLADGTRLLRTRQTIDVALDGRHVPVLIEPDFDELRVGDLDGGPIEDYWSWKSQHSLGDRLPHGESHGDALRRYASAPRRLLSRTERSRSPSFNSSGSATSWPPRPACLGCQIRPSVTRFRFSSTRTPSGAPPLHELLGSHRESLDQLALPLELAMRRHSPRPIHRRIAVRPP